MIDRARLQRASHRLARDARIRMRPVWPPVGTVRRLGLRRTEPISRAYGFDRGTPVDRHYIEAFLQRHAPSPDYSAGDIRGRVLEVGGDAYARRFGVRAQIDVLHVDDANPLATIVGDLTDPSRLPAECLRLHHLHADPARALGLSRGDRKPPPDAQAWRRPTGHGPGHHAGL